MSELDFIILVGILFGLLLTAPFLIWRLLILEVYS